MLKYICMVLLYVATTRKVSSLHCYTCDNQVIPACGPNFKAYQFNSHPCPDDENATYKCGKQVQAMEEGWVGVIRSCYSTGILPGLNATNGCQYYHVEKQNFTALYCFCDTDYCNASCILGKDTILTLFTLSTLIYFIFS